MVTAIVSVMTGIPVHRDVAMTGEITLRGRVLPISGLKEKLLAALRGGIKTVLIPEENAKDLVEIADNIKSGLEIIPITRMDEVLTQALLRKPEPTEWDEMKVVCAAASETPPVEEENIGAPSLTLPGSTKPDRKLAFTLCPLSRSGEDQSRSHGPPRRGVLTSFRNPILKGVGFWGRPPAPRR